MENVKFGTDGIRGVYGSGLTDEIAYSFGYALGCDRVLVGYDNRTSSLRLSACLSQGAKDGGASVINIGYCTTPALFYTAKHLGVKYAVMITASHNPPCHNGLKLFCEGGKASEDICRVIEYKMRPMPLPDCGYTPPLNNALVPYGNFFCRNVGRLDGVKIAVDYACGAGCVMSSLLERCGAMVVPLNATPDGKRINVDCGALHPQACAEAVVKYGCDLGIALDGDADRIMAVTEKGDIVDGDMLLYVFGVFLKEAGLLKNNKLAATVMSNTGVLKCLADKGITAISCAVGDHNVAKTMQSEGLNLGGEQSGHIILGDHLATGDGLFAGGCLASILRHSGKPLSALADATPYPQVLYNVSVADKSLATSEGLQNLAASLKTQMKEGRILIRASGTESVVRIMCEHPSRKTAEEVAAALADYLAEISE